MTKELGIIDISSQLKPAISFCFHAHQPLGYGRFESFDRGIYERCYIGNQKLNNYIGEVRGHKFGVTLNISGSVLLELLANKADPVASAVSETFRSILKSSQDYFGLPNLMMQASPFHSIVPLLPKQSKKTQYSWSKEIFRYFFGTEPSGVWLPEQAYDESSLEMIAADGQWTILPQWVKPGADTSLPYKIQTAAGSLDVLLYDTELSNFISQQQGNWDFWKKIHAQNHVPRQGWSLAMDLEAIGEHPVDNEAERQRRLWFLNNILYYQIPNEGYFAVPNQLLIENAAKTTDIIEIAKAGSWSCRCEGSREGLTKALLDRGKLEAYGPYLAHLPKRLDGLLRWCAPCAETNGGNFEANLWKLPYKSGLTIALSKLYELYERKAAEFADEPMAALENYIIVKLAAIDDNISYRTLDAFVDTNFFGWLVDNQDIRGLLAMMEGIYHMEAAQTSCGTFWDSPARLEPRYNVIHAANAMRLFEEGFSLLACGKLKTELAQAELELKSALSLASPSLLSLYSEAKASGRYTEHTHLDKIMALL